MSHLVRVGVLRGGPSNEYDVSLKSEASVLSALRDHHAGKYAVHDIFVDRSGKWHMDGVQIVPEKIIHRVDVVFNAFHGNYGEDGKVQMFLESHGIPFTGSGSVGSAVGMNKVLSKRMFMDNGIKTPYGKVISSSDITDEDALRDVIAELFQTMVIPAIVKPASSGSSVGVTLVKKYDDFFDALKQAASHGDAVIVEEYVPGVEATCGVIEGFRGQELYALPPIEIRPHFGIFDFDAKYAGKSNEIVPSTFSPEIKRELEKLAAGIHRLLGLRHYSRSDFIVHPHRGIYALEVNTLPGLTEESLVPKALKAVGSGIHEFVAHVLDLARKNQ